MEDRFSLHSISPKERSLNRTIVLSFHIAVKVNVAAMTTMGEKTVNLRVNPYPLTLRLTLPFLILSYLAVLARLSARRYMKVSLATDDYMILIASVSSDQPYLRLEPAVENCANALGFQHLRFRECSSP